MRVLRQGKEFKLLRLKTKMIRMSLLPVLLEAEAED